MFAAGWAWLTLDSLQLAPEGIRSVLSGWLYFEPWRQTPGSFLERVRESTANEFNRDVPPEVPINLFAASLYDAVLLYASTVRRLMRAHDTYTDGRALLREMIAEPAFDGMTGRYELASWQPRTMNARAITIRCTDKWAEGAAAMGFTE